MSVLCHRCDRFSGYLGSQYLVCAIHPSGPDQHPCLDFAEVIEDWKPVGLQLVQEGYAVVYHRYLDGCSATADQYIAAEGEARSQRLNFWSQSNPVMPWDYRKSQN